MSNIGNPFVECTSRDMSFKEVFQYWCNPFDCYAIDYHTLTTSATPIIIEGPRGSGKTMILKYCLYYIGPLRTMYNLMRIIFFLFVKFKIDSPN